LVAVSVLYGSLCSAVLWLALWLQLFDDACGILAMENTRKFGLKRKMEDWRMENKCGNLFQIVKCSTYFISNY
jgi:hypothetical protein